MRLKQVSVRAFKRFHQLEIKDLPETAQLVILVGPNGSGKSSLFDAFATWYNHHREWGGFDASYHPKAGQASLSWSESVQLDFHSPVPEDQVARKKLFYIRSAYRNEADFLVSSIKKQETALNDGRRVKRLIDPDIHVSDNYQRLVASTVAKVFDPGQGATTVGELREQLIGKVRTAMTTVFEDLLLSGTGDPLQEGTFFFDKGSSRKFRYSNLSGGEKAAFDILLDFALKNEVYDDTVFCIDEPDLHMHTKTQGRLLGEMMNLLPAKGQLWISTHSIGMMRKAQRLYEKDPRSVVFLDFGDQAFDGAVTLTPVTPNRAFWKRALAVALDDVASLVAPQRVVLCEGRPASPTRPGRAEFDATCLRTIFGCTLLDTDFLSVGNAFDVQTDRYEVAQALSTLVSGTVLVRVIDRDDRDTYEIAALENEGVRVLSRRHLEVIYSTTRYWNVCAW